MYVPGDGPVEGVLLAVEDVGAAAGAGRARAWSRHGARYLNILPVRISVDSLLIKTQDRIWEAPFTSTPYTPTKTMSTSTH